MAELFWLSDEQWQAIAPFMPTNQLGARRKDDPTILSGILLGIKFGCRWKDCPGDYGPPTTVDNRFNRWSRRRFWTGMLEALAKAGWSGEAAALDATYVKAQRAAHGGKGGLASRRSARRGQVRPPRSTSSPT